MNRTVRIFAILLSGKGAKQNLLLGSILIGLAISLDFSLLHILVMALAMSVVIAMEFLNTAIESSVDLLVPKTYHPFAKIAKDCAAGGVMLSSLIAMLITSLIFIPTLVQYLPF